MRPNYPNHSVLNIPEAQIYVQSLKACMDETDEIIRDASNMIHKSNPELIKFNKKMDECTRLLQAAKNKYLDIAKPLISASPEKRSYYSEIFGNSIEEKIFNEFRQFCNDQ